MSKRVIQALNDLSDSEKTIRVPLLRGRAAGERQLINAQFPPEGFTRDSVPARFTVDLEMKWKTASELHLMVELISGGGSSGISYIFVLGLISHSQWQKLCEELPMQTDKVDIHERWVGIVYSPTYREGHAFLSKSIYHILLQTGLE